METRAKVPCALCRENKTHSQQVLFRDANATAQQKSTGKQAFDGVFDNSLNFRIELPWEAALEFIRYVGRYNGFQPHRVIAALERVDELIPRKDYGANNPNTGQRSFQISVGREGSPVVYLDRYEFAVGCADRRQSGCAYLPRNGMRGRR